MSENSAPHPILVLGAGFVGMVIGGFLLGPLGAILGLVGGLISFILTARDVQPPTDDG